ncbi:universal stress protein [Corallococcus sp. M34]|uniref:universal stress protein n=1 Tax=Citreicoccus inhibens TaxID=2849499 RepID=UPI001C22C39B|nr:universal stress protein [Citreicoccus inhibens]MBU8897310.1 universal stress protein [Citreicoccus inhibens]
MAIVCATNLSPESGRAAAVAAALAGRLGEPLLLLDVSEAAPVPTPDTLSSEEAHRERLEAEAERLRASGVTVLPPVLAPSTEGSRREEVECQRARLVVVAADGWPPASWPRTSLAARLTRYGRAPVLVVRRDGALLDWARGRRRLLVLAGVDRASSTSDAALTFLRELRRVGACDVVAACVCSPLEERERLGMRTPVHVELLDPGGGELSPLEPAMERVLLRELRERVGELEGEGGMEVVVEPGYGRPADHLLHVARARGADVLVVGTHLRRGVRRLWHGSVSEGVLRRAEQSVVCVPPGLREPRHAQPPRTVLVPVDFTEASVRAVSQARLLVGAGGRVHLLHVHRRRLRDPSWLDTVGVPPEPEGDAVLRRLWTLVPWEEGARAVHWSVEGVTSEDVPLAIRQATEREGADLVCLGLSSTSDAPDTLKGAVARELVLHGARPVLVLPDT